MGQTRCRIDAADTRADAPHALHRRRKIDRHGVRWHCAEVGRVAHVGVSPRRAYQRFRGHTAVVQAVTSEPVTRNQRDLRAQRGGGASGDQTGRSGTDDQEVITVARLRVPPLRRAHIGEEIPLMRALNIALV